MEIMRLFFLLIALFAFSVLPVYAADINAGFVEGIWFREQTVVAGKPTRMYVALRNNSTTDLTGTVRFSDNGVRVGSSYVSALPGRLVEAWIDWTPTYGEHKVSASLSDIRIHAVGENAASGEVDDTLAERTIFIDYDTDGDGILNTLDTDDDNDGVSDSDEEKAETDPLTANLPTTHTEAGLLYTGKKDAENSDSGIPEEETQTPPENIPAEPRDGLETYIPHAGVRQIVEEVTDSLNTTRQKLDTYRASKGDTFREYMEGSNNSSTTFSVETGSGTGTLATITRSTIPHTEEKFTDSVISAGKALASGSYALLLWLASRALAYPALTELFLLLFILYVVYRIARKLGRRRN